MGDRYDALPESSAPPRRHRLVIAACASAGALLVVAAARTRAGPAAAAAALAAQAPAPSPKPTWHHDDDLVWPHPSPTASSGVSDDDDDAAGGATPTPRPTWPHDDDKVWGDDDGDAVATDDTADDTADDVVVADDDASRTQHQNRIEVGAAPIERATLAPTRQLDGLALRDDAHDPPTRTRPPDIPPSPRRAGRQADRDGERHVRRRRRDDVRRQVRLLRQGLVHAPRRDVGQRRGGKVASEGCGLGVGVTSRRRRCDIGSCHERGAQSRCD